MRKNITIAVIFSLMLSGCATYKGVDGRSHLSDPSVCNSGACGVLVVAAMLGAAIALTSHH